MISDKDNIQDAFDLATLEKFSEELADTLDHLRKDHNISAAIDEIFASSNDFNEIEAKITLLIEQYAQEQQKDLGPEFEKLEISKHIIAKRITKLGKEFMKKHQEMNDDPDSAEYDSQNSEHYVSNKAKKEFQKLIKNFVVYQIYKVMNPRRIAGETEKINYMNNAAYRGQDKADKYAGKNRPTLSASEAKQIVSARTNFQRGGRVFGR